MNYVEAKEQALEALVPKVGQHYYVSDVVLGRRGHSCFFPGGAQLVRVTSVVGQSVAYTLVQAQAQRYVGPAATLDGYFRLKAWWSARNEGLARRASTHEKD